MQRRAALAVTITVDATQCALTVDDWAGYLARNCVLFPADPWAQRTRHLVSEPWAERRAGQARTGRWKSNGGKVFARLPP